MRNNVLVSGLALGLGIACCATLPLTTSADTLTLSEASAGQGTAELPQRGEVQGTVLKRFGEPTTRYAAVGGGSPVHPPITRWDYPGFSVFFENRHVVHAVIPGQPAQLYNVDTLQRDARN